MDIENLKEVGVDIFKDLLKRWHLDLIFFIAISCEVLCSQFILPSTIKYEFSASNIFILLGYCVFWYSTSVTSSVIVIINFTFVSNLNNTPINVGGTLLPISLILSGFSLFAASILVLLLSFAGVHFHLHLLNVVLSFAFLFVAVKFILRRINRKLKKS